MAGEYIVECKYIVAGKNIMKSKYIVEVNILWRVNTF